LPDINPQKTYQLRNSYENIKERATRLVDQYPGVIKFDDSQKSVAFYTEKLIPTTSTNRPRVMLLFSNPHPHSIQQGMFLSPNSRRRESLFWSAMRDADWIKNVSENIDSRQLAEIFFKAEYQGPFELVFYCYYAFPTHYPEDISKIFGKDYFKQFIEPEAEREFRKTVQETGVEAVVAFNKGIFNLVSKDRIERYIDRLIKGEIVQSQINDIDRSIPIFLTFPTGWRYQSNFRKLRKASLDTIRIAIC
jgi:hypothetical protein